MSSKDQEQLSDIEIINLTLDTDKECFNLLVNRYYLRIFRYLNRLLYHNKADAEDCMSETFIKAYVNLSTYSSRTPFSAWLYRIAHNQAIDVMRKNTRHVTESIDDHLDQIVYDPISDQLNKDAVERILDLLPTEDKNLLILFYFEELSLEEISDILKIKANTVAVRLKRVRERVRSKYSHTV